MVTNLFTANHSGNLQWDPLPQSLDGGLELLAVRRAFGVMSLPLQSAFRTLMGRSQTHIWLIVDRGSLEGCQVSHGASRSAQLAARVRSER